MILALDPGLDKTGVARLDTQADTIDIIEVIAGREALAWLTRYVEALSLREASHHIVAIEGWEDKFWQTKGRIIKDGPAMAKLIEELSLIPQRDKNIRTWIQMSTTVSQQITFKNAQMYLKAKGIKAPDNNHSIDAVKHALFASGQWGLIRAAFYRNRRHGSRRHAREETQRNH